MLPDLTSVPSGVYPFEVKAYDQDTGLDATWLLNIKVVICSKDEGLAILLVNPHTSYSTTVTHDSAPIDFNLR